ncbi:MAG TPA: tetratricopeptide repeat protein [Verrucomicrobiae bacterium]|nr:tetratricopeptide repeat protein [Verrucomicrobiae bacterium]
MKGRTFFPLLVIAAGLLAYQNSFTGGFFHDDFASIPENPTIRHLWPIWEPLSPPRRGGPTVEGRPLVNLSLAVNYAFGGYNVWGYHAFNLTIHILAGLTLLGIVRRTLLQPALRDRFGAAAGELALATAILWTVHPLQTESVTYIVQRAESMMGLFYLLTLYCFIRGVESARTGIWYGLSVAACALGVISKEVMVTGPVMVLLYDRTFVSGSFREAWQRHWPLYLGLSASWILQAIVLAFGQAPTTFANAKRIDRTWWQYLATEPGVILYYLRLSVWPSPLGLDHKWPIARTWMSILPTSVVVAALVAATIWASRRNRASTPTSGPAWGFVGAWFFLILAPSSSVVPLLDPLYEHRMYLPLAAVVSAVVTGLYAVAGRKSLAAFAVMAIGLGLLTWQHNRDYQRNPHFSLGIALQRAGRVQEAIVQFDQAAQSAPDDAELHYDLGSALEEAGKVPEGIAQYEQALRIQPDFAEAHNNLGVALARLGRGPEAIHHFMQALRIRPDYADAHYNLGLALQRAGRLEDAVEHWREALRLRPDFAEAYNSLGMVLWRAGKAGEAIAYYQQALQLDPDYAEAHNNLGAAFWQAGRTQEAIGHWKRALQLRPDYAEAHNNFGLALEQLGRPQEAIAHYKQALRLQPDMAEAHNNLGNALERVGKTQEAIAQYEEALRIRPDFTEAQNRLARLRAAP